MHAVKSFVSYVCVMKRFPMTALKETNTRKQMFFSKWMQNVQTFTFFQILPWHSSWWSLGSSGHAPLLNQSRTRVQGSRQWPHHGRTYQSSAPWSEGPTPTLGPAGSRRSWRSRQRRGPESSSGLWSSHGVFSPAAESAWCMGQRSATAHQLESGHGLPGSKNQTINQSRLHETILIRFLSKIW